MSIWTTSFRYSKSHLTTSSLTLSSSFSLLLFIFNFIKGGFLIFIIYLQRYVFSRSTRVPFFIVLVGLSIDLERMLYLDCNSSLSLLSKMFLVIIFYFGKFFSFFELSWISNFPFFFLWSYEFSEKLIFFKIIDAFSLVTSCFFASDLSKWELNFLTVIGKLKYFDVFEVYDVISGKWSPSCFYFLIIYFIKIKKFYLKKLFNKNFYKRFIKFNVQIVLAIYFDITFSI